MDAFTDGITIAFKQGKPCNDVSFIPIELPTDWQTETLCW
jgi:hypothetical protein